MELRKIVTLFTVACIVHGVVYCAQPEIVANVLQGVPSGDVQSSVDSDEWSYEDTYSPRQSPQEARIIHVNQSNSPWYFVASNVPLANKGLSKRQQVMQERRQALAQVGDAEQKKNQEVYDLVMNRKAERLGEIVSEQDGSLDASISVRTFNSLTVGKPTAYTGGLCAHLIAQRAFSPTGSELGDVDDGQFPLGFVDESQHVQEEICTVIPHKITRKPLDHVSTKAVCGRDRTVEPGSGCCSSK